jgi:hypothetical protein
MEHMLPSMTARDRRALAVGICVVAAAIAARLAPVGWRWLDARTTDARARAAAAGRAVQSARDLPRTRAALASMQSQLARYDSAAVDGDAPASAGAELADLVSTAANAAEAQVTSVQLLPPRPSNDGFGRVAARVDVTGDLEALAIMFEGLEVGPQLVAIRTLNITQPDAALPAGRRETLRAQMEVEALYRPAPDARTP